MNKLAVQYKFCKEPKENLGLALQVAKELDEQRGFFSVPGKPNQS